MQFKTPVAAIAGLVFASSLSLSAQPAVAFTVTRESSFSNLLSTLLGDTTGLRNFSGSVNGFPEAFGTFENDPFGLGRGVVLSTGKVTDLPGQNALDDFFEDGDVDLNTEFDSDYSDPIFDIATLEITFEADETVEKLFFQYVFGSEEFLEYAGSLYDDFFNLELNGTNLALLNDSVGTDNLVRVNNLVQRTYEDPTSDLPTGFDFSSDYINNPAGPGTQTKLDGYTRTLKFEGNLITGLNTLKIQIADVSDPALDTAVFIQGGTLGTVDPTLPEEPVGVPEPATALGLVAVGLLGVGLKQRYQA